jgi:hypothetical protein
MERKVLAFKETVDIDLSLAHSLLKDKHQTLS